MNYTNAVYLKFDCLINVWETSNKVTIYKWEDKLIPHKHFRIPSNYYRSPKKAVLILQKKFKKLTTETINVLRNEKPTPEKVQGVKIEYNATLNMVILNFPIKGLFPYILMRTF